jgi:hypothetical protein
MAGIGLSVKVTLHYPEGWGLRVCDNLQSPCLVPGLIKL